MQKEKRTPKTIYMAPSLWDIVDQRAKICNRTRSEQVEFMVQMCLKYQMDNDEQAILMAGQAKKSQS